MSPLLDLVIVGGGLSGLTLAHALRRQCPQLQLLVLEQPRQLAAHGDDPRQLALARHSLQLLTRWQLWPQLAAHASPIQRIEVSDAGLPGLARLDAGHECYGQVVAAGALSQLLQQQQLPLCSQPLQALTQQADSVQLTLADGRQLRSKLVVLADGGSRQWDLQLGQRRHVRDYQRQALISVVRSDRPHQGCAFERFTAAGPLALLPLAQDSFSLVWCGDAATTAARSALAPAAFNQQLQRALGYRAGCLQLDGARHSFPLALMTVERLAGHRLLWLGNAAHSLHPVAGQGFNLALRDIDTLVRLLAADAGADAGAYPLLAAYEQQRQADIAATVAFTDGLLALFANRYAPLVAGRTLALWGLNLCPLAQRAISRQGMGLAAP